jgi:site-specific recombinase XerD
MSAISVDEPPTMPLEPKEYERLLTQCAKEFEPKKAVKVHALIQSMRYSGLAITDTVVLERDRLVWDAKLKLYRIVTSRQKTGTDVSVVLPSDVSAEILAVANGNSKYIFWATGNGLAQSAVTNWQHDLRQVFKGAGLYIHDQLSHRLRDTFAVELLKKGVPLEEVARLLGNSMKVCEKHYAKWTPGRQERTDALVIGTF